LAAFTQNKGLAYETLLACRGNIGWITKPETFQTRRVVRYEGDSKIIVQDFESNPYPNGIIVEGLALLVRPSVTILNSGHQSVDTPGGPFFFQWARLQKNSQNFLVLNIHGGHKVNHFEQAVATRQWIEDQGWGQEPLLIAGDFNAQVGEVSTVPWSLENKFTKRNFLEPELQALNRNQNYKPWATIPENEAGLRISNAVSDLQNLIFLRAPQTLLEALISSSQIGSCDSIGFADPHCNLPERIDQIYLSPQWQALQTALKYPQNTWNNTTLSLSDHPAIMVEAVLTSSHKERQRPSKVIDATHKIN
jgi:hypothetical protein